MKKRKLLGSESAADQAWELAQQFGDKADTLSAESDKAKDYFSAAGVGKAYKSLGYRECELALMNLSVSLRKAGAR